MSEHPELIAILDFGGQYTQLIARRIRELGVFSEIFPHDADLAKRCAGRLKGVVLSGGPDSVYSDNAPVPQRGLFELGVPTLGICYGMQWMMSDLGGEVVSTDEREFGPAQVRIVDRDSILFAGLSGEQPVWASHGDRVVSPAPGFVTAGRSENAPFAAVEDRQRRLFGVQFHPEVAHTAHGTEVLQNFLFEACGCSGAWSIHGFVEQATKEIREQVGDERVICGLSGGVDSSVMALLLHRALGDKLTCVFVDNGVLRKNEADEVLGAFRERYHLRVQHADAADLFLDRLAGVEDPEQKRKIIGNTFI